ncbi:MAG: hypothetical protein D6805_08435 [Planctomycetota bacterium]|nr:MAG: hypothetical protein D6805_08435 [Planctomycetota bacterium]
MKRDFFPYFALYFLLFSPLLQAQDVALPADKMLVIHQLSNGLLQAQTKQSATRMIRQRLYIAKDRLRIESMEGQRTVVIVRLDKRLLWKWNPQNPKKEYEEVPFSKFEREYKRRLRRKASFKQRILTSALPKRRKVEILQQAYLNPFGPDLVSVGKSSQKKEISGFPCEEWIVERNGFEVARLWTTKGAYSPSYLFRFYKALKAFTPEEERAIEKIEGFPILLRIRLQYFIGASYKVFDIYAHIQNIEQRPLELYPFRLPPGWKKKSTNAVLKCAYPKCKNLVKVKKFRVIHHGKVYYCCKQQHQIKLMILFAKQR